MGLFARLRERFQSDSTEPQPASTPAAAAASQTETDGWQELSAYRPVDPAEHRVACVAATAIAAADRPTSTFNITGVQVADEEYRRVAAIATAIAAGDRPESSFVVRKIYKRKQEEQDAS